MQHQIQSIKDFFTKERIHAYASLPIEACRIDEQKAKRVRLDFAPKSVLVFLIPYYVSQGKNLSAYATGEDYHLYSAVLGEKLCAHLEGLFSGESFRFFCDKSPIDERRAAAKAGLGVACVIGDFVEKELADGSLIHFPMSTEIPKRKIGFACKNSTNPTSSMEKFMQLFIPDCGDFK